jgi:dATP pyrophosphohydrolase
VLEETGIDASANGAQLCDWGLENVYEIYPQWRWRYAPQVSHNTERVFGLRLTSKLPVCISSEHTAYAWLPMSQAMERCFSPSNAEAISWLPRLG